MSPEEAYKIIRKKWPFTKILSCLDLGSFYLFDLAPIGEDSQYRSGPSMYAVNKKTKKVFIYNILSDPDLYLSAKPIVIKDIMDTRLSEVRLN